jgi:hypothetical protein
MSGEGRRHVAICREQLAITVDRSTGSSFDLAAWKAGMPVIMRVNMR